MTYLNIKYRYLTSKDPRVGQNLTYVEIDKAINKINKKIKNKQTLMEELNQLKKHYWYLGYIISSQPKEDCISYKILTTPSYKLKKISI